MITSIARQMGSRQSRRSYCSPTQLRNKMPSKLENPRPLIVACPPMKSNINLSAMARASSCMGTSRLVLCGTSKLWPHISRQGLDSESEAIDLEAAKSSDAQSLQLHGMNVTLHRSLLPVLQKLKKEQGYSIVGLEQTSTSQSSYDFKWPHKTVLVVGHESNGISQEILNICDKTVEIPLYGLPFSLNVSHALAIALSSYCQQYPEG